MKQVITVVIGLVGLAMAFDAAAWAHRTTDSGKNVRWERAEITISLDPSLASVGPMDAVERSVNRMLDQWSEQADLPVDFVVVREACGAIGYKQNGENHNCLLADESWARKGEDVGATTVLTFKGNSGAIVDADIVFNAMEWRWSVNGEVADLEERSSSSHGDNDQDDHDLPSILSFEVVLTHELGHLLGLAHSEEQEAIMYPTTSTGIVVDINLSEDDVEGAVALYEGLEEKLAAQDGYAAGCQAVPGRATSGSSLGWLLLLGLLFVGRKVAPARIRRR